MPKIATFNVNSLNVRLPVVLDWIERHKPDALCLQETKLADPKFPLSAFTERGLHVVFHGQPTYNGVAIITRQPLTDVTTGVGDPALDVQPRLIAGRLGDLLVVNTYVPQGQQVGSEKFAFKLAWLAAMRRWIAERCSPSEQVVWVGDFNVAMEDIDCYAPDFFEGECSLTEEERTPLRDILAWGMVDVFRKLHPGKPKQYTFFDYRVRDSVRFKKGWRIDHIWATASVAARATACEIDIATREPEKASDHAPVWASFDDGAAAAG